MSDNITVLIVEDNHDDAELMVLELEASGFDVSWQRIENQEAFGGALTDEIDIVLADYNLPQFSAPEALDLVQRKKMDTPVIVVTGSISEEVAVSCIKMGAADYLIKDRLSRLGEAVRLALQQRNLRRAKRETERDLTIMSRAIDTSLNGVVMGDLNGRVNYVNKAFLELIGWEDESTLLGHRFDEVWPDSQQITELIELVSRGEYVRGEMPIVRQQTGAERVLQYAAGLVLDDSNQPLQLMGIFIDITEQKQAEKAQQEAEILKIQLEKESELRALKSRFISMVVHDFRNPVSAIKLALDLLQKYGDQMKDERRIEKLEMMMSQTLHLNQLIDDVLMIGRMESVATEFNPTEQDLVIFCKVLFADFTSNSDTTKHQFELICHHDSLIMPFDRSLFTRALLNLLSNAVKYSPDGGVITLSSLVTADSVAISVSDTGIGIPPEDQMRLYDGFHRADNVGLIPGSGLGLAIVKQIVETHGGTIMCESELGKGTTFTMTLPR